MSSIFSGTLTKIVAQIAALVLVVGGLAAFVVTQANADKPLSADAENSEQPTENQPLDIERVSSVTPLSAAQVQVPQLIEINVGEDTKEVLTTGETVQEVLDNAGVSVDTDDKVSPKPEQNINADTAITVTVVEKTEVTEEENIEFETTHEDDDTLEEGKTKTEAEGENGTAVVTYEVITENGEEVDKTETDREVTEKPTTEVILRGTKEPEPEEPAPSSSSDSEASSSSSSSDAESSSDSDSSADSDSNSDSNSDSSSDTESSSDDSDSSSSSDNSGADAPAVSNGSTWDALAECESGGNWSTNTGNGYHGGLQFNPTTWNSMGGQEYAPTADQATREQQIAVASKLQAQAGWGQWPACSSSLGLR